MTVPCCEAIVSLDALHYDWPVGFARFEVSAMNPTRAKYELDAQDLAEVSAVLGHCGARRGDPLGQDLGISGRT